MECNRLGKDAQGARMLQKAVEFIGRNRRATHKKHARTRKWYEWYCQFNFILEMSLCTATTATSLPCSHIVGRLKSGATDGPWGESWSTLKECQIVEKTNH
jgi:hypothetical protein